MSKPRFYVVVMRRKPKLPFVVMDRLNNKEIGFHESYDAAMKERDRLEVGSAKTKH